MRRGEAGDEISKGRKQIDITAALYMYDVLCAVEGVRWLYDSFIMLAGRYVHQRACICWYSAGVSGVEVASSTDSLGAVKVRAIWTLPQRHDELSLDDVLPICLA